MLREFVYVFSVVCLFLFLFLEKNSLSQRENRKAATHVFIITPEVSTMFKNNNYVAINSSRWQLVVVVSRRSARED